MEKPISRKGHGVFDYSYATLMLAAPEIVGFEDHETAALTSRAIGCGVVLASLLTRYELGLAKVMPYKVHLALDVAVSLFALSAPWLLGFSKNVKARNTFIAAGLAGLAVVALSKPGDM